MTKLIITMVTIFASFAPALATATSAMQDDQVVVQGANFDLTAGQLGKFLNDVYKPYPMTVTAIGKNSTSYLIPMMSIGTDSSYIRSVSFTTQINGSVLSGTCEIILELQKADSIFIHNCSSSIPSVKINDVAGKLSSYTNLR